MSKNALVALSVAGFLATSGVAFAQSATATGTASMQNSGPAMELTVSSKGNAVIRGTVASVTSGSLTMQSWGGTWTITVPASATMYPQNTALSDIQVGDVVGVQGSVDTSGSWTITARTVRDWSTRKTMESNKQTIHQTESEGARVLQGAVSNLDSSAQTFTLTTTNGKAFSVTLASGAKLLTKSWLALDFSKVANGDVVRVFGTVSSSTVSASILRDTVK